MNTPKTFTTNDVTKIASLANIPVTDEEKEALARGFTTTIIVVEKLNSLETENVEPTHQVTGLANVTREDVVDESRMFRQEVALNNAKHTHKGYFVVDQILDTDGES